MKVLGPCLVWVVLLEALVAVTSQGTWQQHGAGNQPPQTPWQGPGYSPVQPPVSRPGQGYPPQASPPQGYPPQGSPPQGYPPQGSPPQGYPPQGSPPQGYPPQGSPPQGYPPQGSPPQGYPPQGSPPQGYPPQGSPPQGYPPQGSPPQGSPPQGAPPQGPGPAGPRPPINVKYLILGAGASGLQAAQTLISKGETDFMVLEAAETYGGRIRDVPFAGARVEAGADSPRPMAEAFESSVRGLGGRMRVHTPKWQSMNMISDDGLTNLSNVAFQTHAWPRIAYTVREGLNLAEELLESHDSDMSVRAAFQSLGWFPTAPLDKTMEWLHFDYKLGDVPGVASLKSHRFDASELIIQRGPNANPHCYVTEQRGFKSYFDANLLLMKDPASREKIQFNKEVVAVNYGSPDHVTVTCRDGSVYRAEWVICTFSLGVLQRQIVKFTPEFPGWKTRELNRFVMGAHTKVFLEFPNTFWGSREFVLRVSDKRGHFPLFVDLGTRIPELRRSDRHVLMAEVTGDEARRIDAQSTQETTREIMRVLRRMFKFSIPEPLAVHVSGWNSNPLTMGSHSLWNPALNVNCFHKVQSRLGRLLFAGEHTSLYFSGHIQGALESGAREADKAYLCSTGGTCPQWLEGASCACTGTPPPQLGSASRAKPPTPLTWAVALAVLLAAVRIGS